MKLVAGVSVTVARGVSTGTLTAVPALTQIEVQAEDDHTVRLKVRDYLVGRNDFEAIVGVGEKPDRGDKFTEIIADYSRDFEAKEVGGEVSRWWDKGGEVLRIHTVETTKDTTTTVGA